MRKECDFLLKKVNVCISEKQYAILQQASKDNYCTQSFVVRLALNSYFSKKGWFSKYGNNQETK